MMMMAAAALVRVVALPNARARLSWSGAAAQAMCILRRAIVWDVSVLYCKTPNNNQTHSTAAVYEHWRFSADDRWV
jgi:hypothetical protein